MSGPKARAYPPNKENYLELSASQKKYAWAQFNVKRRNNGQALVWPNFMPDGIGVTHKPPGWQKVPADYPRILAREYHANPKKFNKIVAQPIANKQAGPLLDSFNKSPTANTNASPSTSAGSGNHRPINSPGTIERLLDEHDRQQAGTSTSNPGKRPAPVDHPGTPAPKQRPSTTTEGSTTTMATGGSHTRSGASYNHVAMDTSAPVEESGHNSKADGGFDSAQGPLGHIEQPMYNNGSGFMTFKKIHHMKSFAIPFKNIESGDNKFTTTPLAEIPWQYMYFYMSKNEFDLIPPGSRAVSCKVSVQNIISSTGHPVGGTIASLATFNHPKIGVLAYDLLKTSRGGRTYKLTMSSTEDVLPIAVGEKNPDTFILNQYGTDQSSGTWNTDALPGACFPIPFNTYDYFCVYQPSATAAATIGFTNQNAPGYENFNSCITQFNLL